MGAVAMGSVSPVPRGKLRGWVALVAVLAAVSYAAQLSTSGTDNRDVLYDYATAIGALVQYTIVLSVVLLIARGADRRELFALRRPASWGRAIGLTIGALLTIWAIGYVLNIFLKAGEEQGLVPDRWEPDHAGAFAANFVAVAFVAPIVEELAFRGLGYTAVRAFYGTGAAVVATALAFGLAHGLLVALPVLSCFGAILALLRAKTGSLYPPIILHAFFNGAALVAAVTIGTGP